MKKYFSQFKPFFVFISTFFVAYILLMLIYKFYLNQFQSTELDGMTQIVGRHVEYLMQLCGSDIKIQKNLGGSFLEVWYKQSFFIRIVEGCNAVSVMILFVSFIVSFSGKLKTTILFLLFGIVFIHVLNVIRIALLTVLLFRFHKYEQILHGVFFPLVIYGTVFILWVVWVNKFSKYAK
ncbi:exosortase family protein XrtF [Flavobacterium sp. GA093]|uniref:Exosortase family protein XrtF n=1 Tax=Flavobacterium hydrocarbonoxydans TaxID=2683249 RepID=A0A6I4NMY5_9FLAO|nr:exosortase family protein XrtF [Flavobacterium hydrocarbonoxydans]MWB95766.1 exosortase family protein XrtF [Flavobacterium hydrocarbonoxydans]